MRKIILYIKNNIPILGGVVLILFVLLYFFKELKVFVQRLFNPKADAIYVKMDEANSTISDFQAKQMAENLYISMASFGTDEALIFDTLKGVSSADFSKIYNFFGERLYWDSLGTWTNDSIFSNGHPLDLFGWLSSELSVSELMRLKRLAPLAFPSK